MDWFHQFKTDENQALKEIYRNHRKECITYAHKKFGVSQEDAVDIFQQAVLVLYHNTASGKLTELSSGIKAYLFGVIRLKCLEFARTSRKTVYPEDLHTSLATIPDEPMEEESQLISVLKTLLPTLGASCRQLLELYYYNDKSIHEIFELGGYSGDNSVKTQKHKCVKRLHSMILEHISIKRPEN